MTVLTKKVLWAYHEFGLASVVTTGQDGWLIILARAGRMFSFAATTLILALFFAALDFTDFQIGLFMTLTLLGDVVLSLWLTQIADRVDRRNVIMAGSLLMVSAGAAFALFENFWILLLAAVTGVMTTLGGDFGPFRSIEESMLSTITNPHTRSDVLSWYVTIASIGSCLGSEVAGRMVQGILDSSNAKTAYHTAFWMYSAMGLINICLVFGLSNRCEAPVSEHKEQPVHEEESEQLLEMTKSIDHESSDESSTKSVSLPPKGFDLWRPLKALSEYGGPLAEISPETRSVMYKLWFLLMVDSVADGMVPFSLVNYYMDKKFTLAKSTLGDFQSISYFLSALSLVFAAPLSRRLGLINTMVFTHIPSSTAVLLFALPQNVPMTAVLLFIRQAFNNLDQAPRSAFIAAVVKPSERTVVMGITTMLRTLAAASGPLATGLLANSDRFWIAFVAAGASRLAYDFGLWALFVNMELYKHEGGQQESAIIRDGTGVRVSDEEET